jgi:ubiquinone/menaquinone biosynthesis C-methylase UbiE
MVQDIKKIEQETADLYSDCFSRLNDWDDSTWFKQGEMLYTNFALTPEKVQGKKCLDGGCGHGTFSYQLLKNGAGEVYGVDLHKTLKEGVFDKYPNMHFVQASLLNLPFSDNTFDLIVSNGVLHHTVDALKCFKEYVRVLKPGGKVMLGVYGQHGLFPYVLSFCRIFTVKIPVISKSFAKKVIDLFKFNPMLRYQLLDYLYVPCLNRYTPKQIINDFFLDNGLKNQIRVFGLTPGQAKYFREEKTVYTYDPRTLSSRLLFGYGFIVVEGTK